eukprot:Gb_04350 [translate_table: standard]
MASRICRMVTGSKLMRFVPTATYLEIYEPGSKLFAVSHAPLIPRLPTREAQPHSTFLWEALKFRTNQWLEIVPLINGFSDLTKKLSCFPT